MPHKIRLNNFPKAVLDRKYLVDGNEDQLREILKVNFYEAGDDKISVNEVRSIINLEPGESIFINIVEVKRIT